MSRSERLDRWTRRELFKLSAAGFVGYSCSGWLEAMADEVAANPQRRGQCILLWMNGGPTQTDTFDPKPDHPNGGEFRPIQTSVPGIQISEVLPGVAQQMHHMALVRSMSTREGDHGRATYLLRTGYVQEGPIDYPLFGSSVSKELGNLESELPNFVSIAPEQNVNADAFTPGFLGSTYAPFVVGQDLQVQNLERRVAETQFDRRIGLLESMQNRFVERHAYEAARSHRTAYQRAVTLMRSEARRAFDLNEEPQEVRDRYGQNPFGQGCLMARRLIERGVPFVEVTHNGNGFTWDSHQDNFNQVRGLCGILDPAWTTLMTDLAERGLLETTLIVWMGEFGRTPQINGNNGRDHFPDAWSTVLAGGLIRGGQVIGDTGVDGMAVQDRPVSVPDLLATVCRALGVDPRTQNMSPIGRPIRIVHPDAQPIEELLA